MLQPDEGARPFSVMQVAGSYRGEWYTIGNRRAVAADPLTPEQTICLLKVVEGHRLCALYHIALTLGLRLGELLGLQWGDIDWQAQTIAIRRQDQETRGRVAVRNATKTDAGMRALPLPPRLLARLRQLWETRGDALFLFPARNVP